MKTKIAYNILGFGTLLLWLAVEFTAGAIIEIGTGWCALIFLLTGVAFAGGTVLWLCVGRRPPLVGLISGVLGLVFALYGILPGGDGVLERVKTSDGSELMIVQKHNGEPYSIGFYFRKAGGNWGWFYYEHEDTRWIKWIRHIRLSPDHKQAIMHRLLWPVATFDLEKEIFTIHRWQRSSPVQRIMPPDWDPEGTL